MPKKSPANQALGKAIRAARVHRGYSQEGFAQSKGLDRSHFGAIERGELNISIDTLVRITSALETTAAALCHEAKI
jgi:transcriptional regulator with XRE-family HTH domain